MGTKCIGNSLLSDLTIMTDQLCKCSIKGSQSLVLSTNESRAGTTSEPDTYACYADAVPRRPCSYR